MSAWIYLDYCNMLVILYYFECHTDSRRFCGEIIHPNIITNLFVKFSAICNWGCNFNPKLMCGLSTREWTAEIILSHSFRKNRTNQAKTILSAIFLAVTNSATSIGFDSFNSFNGTHFCEAIFSVDKEFSTKFFILTHLVSFLCCHRFLYFLKCTFILELFGNTF